MSVITAKVACAVHWPVASWHLTRIRLTVTRSSDEKGEGGVLKKPRPVCTFYCCIHEFRVENMLLWVLSQVMELDVGVAAVQILQGAKF